MIRRLCVGLCVVVIVPWAVMLAHAIATAKPSVPDDYRIVRDLRLTATVACQISKAMEQGFD